MACTCVYNEKSKYMHEIKKYILNSELLEEK